MSFSISKLFGNKQKSDFNSNQSQNGNLSIAGTTPTGGLIITKNIDWRQKAFHEAGVSSGDINAFHAGFQAAFEGIKKSQQLDNVLQEKMKTQLQQDIVRLKGEKTNKETQLESEESKLKDIESEITDKTEEKRRILEGNTRDDKTTKVNLWIGGILIAFLTIYLFIFYSSTAYSAFFKDWEINTNFDQGGSFSTTEATFDGQAVHKAFRDNGLGGGLFVLFMPFVFMGLGYVAHHTGKDGHGFLKYAKIILMYLLTFAFDCLLAYNIALNAYNTRIIMLPPPQPAYNIAMAVVDPEFWKVIFCGFVAYVIWGLLYSFVMDCYNKLKDNTAFLQSIKEDIEKLRAKKMAQQQIITSIKVDITTLKTKIEQKEQEFTSSVRYDFNSIKQHLADYYAGWCAYYTGALFSTGPLSQAYEKEFLSVKNWIDSIKNKNKQTTEDKK